MKKVSIIGASGSLAKHVIDRLKTEKDVALTLFLRNKDRLMNDASGCKVIEGDAMNYASLKNALEGQSTTTRETRYDKGLEVQKSIFGEMIDKMYEASPDNLLHIQKYLSANCFGDYYTRTGLDIKTRELLTYSMLISMGGTESKVMGHVKGNVNVGNNRETLLGVTAQLLP